MNEFLRQFEEALKASNRLKADEILQIACKQAPAQEVIEQLVVPTLLKIGKDWEEGKVALAQIYMSGRICEELVNNILPSDVQRTQTQPRAAIAVLHDYHMLGKKIVYSMLRASGFELIDYGRKTVDELVTCVLEDRIEVLLISVLMLPSALKIKQVREKLKQAGSNVILIVGGAPFNFDSNLWQEVGADAMGHNAAEAVTIVRKIKGGMT